MAEQKPFLDKDGVLYVKQKIKTANDKKVDKVEGMGLSHNDLTDDLLEKINNAGDSSFSGSFDDLSNKPTTVAGYGITDAKIEGKKVTLGANSVTVPSSTSELTNDAGFQTASQVSSAISSATQNLATNDSVSSAISTATTNMATKTYVTQQLANINKKTVVTSTTQMTDANTIYLMANEGSGNNMYDEYIVVDGTPEKVGTTEVDLTNYVQEDDLVPITNEEIDEIFADL